MEDTLTRRDVKTLLRKLADTQAYRGSNLSQFDIYLLLIMTAEKLKDVARQGNSHSLTGTQLREVIQEWDKLPLVSVSKRFKHCKNVNDILQHVKDRVNVKGRIWLGTRKKVEIREEFVAKHNRWQPITRPDDPNFIRTRPRVSPAEVQFSTHRLKVNALDVLDSELKTSILTYITDSEEYLPIIKEINSRRALHVLVWVATGRNQHVLNGIGKEIIGSDRYYNKTRIRFFREFVIEYVTGEQVHLFQGATDEELMKMFAILAPPPP